VLQVERAWRRLLNSCSYERGGLAGACFAVSGVCRGLAFVSRARHAGRGGRGVSRVF
jgi:hypothetical protein